MSLLISILILLSIDLYIILIVAISIGWFKIKETSINNDLQDINTFSIIIPFKNEASNLTPLLKDLSQLNYSVSNYEIIFVNDDSVDDSVELISKYISSNNLSWLLLSSSGGKKKAIEKAINKAQNKYIISIDADCRIPDGILKAYNTTLIKRETKMISGPVAFYSNNRIFGQLLELEFISLIGSGAGSIGIEKPIMMNAANMLFERKLAIEASNKVYNDKTKSGDDIFLMHFLIEKYGANEIQFLKNKDAIISTKAPTNVTELIKQRIRWTAKARHYKINFTSIAALIVLFLNFIFMISFFMMFLPEYSTLFLFIFIVKTIIDLPLLFSTASFLGQKNRLILLPLLQFIYPFYIVTTAFAGLLSKESWEK